MKLWKGTNLARLRYVEYIDKSSNFLFLIILFFVW